MRGVEDNLYVSFFGIDGKAAMLACDACGIVPEELLFVAKKDFRQTPQDSEEFILVRYTMYERQRQSKLRKLMAEKHKLIDEGANIDELWKERRRITPDAPKVPTFSKKRIQQATDAVDTSSSSDDDRIDERGMYNPPVQVREELELPTPAPLLVNGSAGRNSPPAEPLPAAEGEGTTAAPANEGPSDPIIVFQSVDSPVPAVYFSVDALANHQAQQEPYLYRPHLSSRTNGMEDSTKHNMKKPKPPPMPSLAKDRYPRSIESLSADVKGLDESKRKMEKYSVVAPQQIKDYNSYVRGKEEEDRRWEAEQEKIESRRRHFRFTESLRNRSTTDTEVKSSPLDDTNGAGGTGGGREPSGEPEDAHNGSRRSTGLSSPSRQKAESSFENTLEEPQTRERRRRKAKEPPRAFRIEDPHQRQIEATKRVALQEAKLVSGCYSRGLSAQKEEVPSLGTIAHTLRYQEMIGKAPPMEDRLKEHMRQTIGAQHDFRAERELQWERDKKMTNRLERGAAAAQEKKEKFQAMRKEVNRTKGSLLEGQLRCVERRRTVEMKHRVAKLDEKQRKADDFNTRNMDDAARRRYEHDQEELFRKKMKDTLVSMERTKRWELDSIKRLSP